MTAFTESQELTESIHDVRTQSGDFHEEEKECLGGASEEPLGSGYVLVLDRGGGNAHSVQTFPVKGHTGNISGFGGHTPCLNYSPLSLSTKAAIDNSLTMGIAAF